MFSEVSAGVTLLSHLSLSFIVRNTSPPPMPGTLLLPNVTAG